MDSGGEKGQMHMKGDTTSAQEMTAVELQRAAYQAIARELGAAGLIGLFRNTLLAPATIRKIADNG